MAKWKIPLVLLIITSVCWAFLELLEQKEYVIRSVGQTVKFITGSRAYCPDCNILLISLDTLAATHLPCYGYRKNTAPKLCSFAKEHILYTESFAQSYYTLPSHFSMFTSLYPSTHGMLEVYVDQLDPSYITLPEILSDQGYTTHYFGSVKNSNMPLDKGFGRGFSVLHDVDSDRKDFEHSIDTFISESKEKKTFAFVHTYFVHAPYFTDNRPLLFTRQRDPDIPHSKEEFFSEPHISRFAAYLEAYADDHISTNEMDNQIRSLLGQLRTGEDAAARERILRDLIRKNPTFDYPYQMYVFDHMYRDKTDYSRALYDQRIAELDEFVPSVLERVLREVGNNTIIIVTSDHGESFMEHGSAAHSSLYAEVQRVPLIMYIPGKRNISVTSLFQGIDLLPTILDIVGIGFDADRIEGKSMACLADCPDWYTHPYIISEMFKDGKHAVLYVDSRWKLYVHSVTGSDLERKNSIELFDIMKDPGELQNLSAGNPGVVSSRLNSIRKFLNRRKPAVTVFPASSPSDEDIRKERQQKIEYFHY